MPLHSQKGSWAKGFFQGPRATGPKGPKGPRGAVWALGECLPQTFSENETHPNVTGIPHYGLFKCADDKWISLGIVNEDHFWKSFCKTAGLNDLCELNFRERVERREHIQEILNEKFQSLTADKWEQLLQQADVPVAKIVSLKDLYSSPQLKARDVFINTKKHKFLAQPA